MCACPDAVSVKTRSLSTPISNGAVALFLVVDATQRYDAAAWKLPRYLVAQQMESFESPRPASSFWVQPPSPNFLLGTCILFREITAPI